MLYQGIGVFHFCVLQLGFVTSRLVMSCGLRDDGHHMKKLLGASVLALSCLALACGDDGGGSSTDAGPNTAADAAPRPSADAKPTVLTGLDAVCAPTGSYAAIFDKLSQCRPIAEIFNTQGTDLLSPAVLEKICHETLGPQVDGPTVSVDESKIQACLNYVTATSCEALDFNLDATPCGEIMVGTVATD